MTAVAALLVGAGVVALIATTLDRPVILRAGVALAGLLALAAAHRAHAGLAIHGLVAAIVLANLLRLVMMFLMRRGTRFTEEEERMAAAGLTGLDRAQARHLLDQGLWIDARAGEVLTREDLPVTHLFYLASGTVAVTRGAQPLANIAAPTFVGEMTVLDEGGATATVTLAGPGRFWCVPAAELRLFLRTNPGIKRALENSFVGTLTAKLKLANQALAERSGAAPGAPAGEGVRKA